MKHRTRIKAPKGRGIPHPFRMGDADALANRVCRLKATSTSTQVSDDEIIASIERETGRPIHDREAVFRAIDRLADAVIASQAPRLS